MLWIALIFVFVAAGTLATTRSMTVITYVTLGAAATLGCLLIPFMSCDGRGCYPAMANGIAWPFVMAAHFVATSTLHRRLMRPHGSWLREVAVRSLWALGVLAGLSVLLRSDVFVDLPVMWATMSPVFAVLVLQGWMASRGRMATEA